MTGMAVYIKSALVQDALQTSCLVFAMNALGEEVEQADVPETG